MLRSVDARVHFDFELTELFLFGFFLGISGFLFTFGEILGAFEEGDWRELEDEESGDKNENDINEDDDALRQDVQHQ